MAVLNVHERLLPARPREVGTLLDLLSSPDDALWPGDRWPPMRLNRGLKVGSHGGHGPVRYTVTAYIPSEWVRFTFAAPNGFDGWHEFTVHATETDDTAVLRHTMTMHTTGPAHVTWPLLYRPLHDAVLEDCLDQAERTLTGTVRHPSRWTPHVRALRHLATRL